MKRYLDNIESQRRSASASEEDVSPEDWWRRATVTQRFQWLLAYYSEFSGDYQVLSVKFSYCNTCAGNGYIEVMDMGTTGAKQRKKKCPTCHGVQVRRSINFKGSFRCGYSACAPSASPARVHRPGTLPALGLLD
jgi:hypothetical protein